MHCYPLVGNQYFVTFLVFCTESVMLCPRFIRESVFFTQSVVRSPRFILTAKKKIQLSRHLDRWILFDRKEEHKNMDSVAIGFYSQ